MGAIGTIPKALGFLLSGFVISKWKLSARFISGWSVFIGTLAFVSLIIFSQMGCPNLNMPVMESINEDCGCPDINSLKISPICAKDGLTNYYSPCIAGCTEFELNLTTFTKSYSKCSVIEDQWIENNMSLSKKWIKKVSFSLRQICHQEAQCALKFVLFITLVT